MSNIPGNLIERARKLVVERLCCEAVCSCSAAVALSKAVADERERCAKIAEAESGPGFSCRHVDHAQGFCECSAKAAAIRAPHGRGRR